MQTDVLIAGGGMAGMAAALALGRARPSLSMTLLEQANGFSEVGAGIQLGPNAMRVLYGWGLQDALEAVCAYPTCLHVKDMATGRALGQLDLGERAFQRYGAPYATIHRADLHAVLAHAATQQTNLKVSVSESVEQVVPHEGGVVVHTASQRGWQSQALLGCDGVWSRVRTHMHPNEKPAQWTGHVAYRGLIRMAALPPHLRQLHVQAWLGPRTHAVLYPVKSGEWLNVVVVAHASGGQVDAGWDFEAQLGDVMTAMGHRLDRGLQDQLSAVGQWRLWPLFARKPVWGHTDVAKGAMALLGDAAHPMKPYLAQGASMALEDAWVLGGLAASLPADSPIAWPPLFRAWGQQRWARVAWVQRRAARNGMVFHARGPLRWARNASMRWLGSGVMDVPRLYDGPPPLKPMR